MASPLRVCIRAAAIAFATVQLASGCGGLPAAPASNAPYTLHLGYLANLTHAPAIAGLQKGFFEQALGIHVTLQLQAFNAGPAEVQAIFAGALDAAFMGPSATINGFVQSHGEEIRLVAGATYGGAGLVVRPAAGIHSPTDLRGKTIADPQLGNTQDVALRAYLLDHGLKTDPQTGSGDVKIVPTDNATALQLFRQGEIDGAWIPEPWTTRLIVDGGGELLVDEATLWPQGRFPTTQLVVSSKLLGQRPDVVRGLIKGLLTSLDWVSANRDDAKAVVDAGILSAAQAKLSQVVLDRAWDRLGFGPDPLVASMKKSANDAQRTGLVSNQRLDGLVDLTILNAELKASGKPPVSADGLGKQ